MSSATDIYTYLPPYLTNDVPAYEDRDGEEGYEKTLIDEGQLVVIRRNGVVAAQVHSPVDLVDLSYRLAEHGYMATEMEAYEDGVIELLLRDLGEEPPADLPEQEAKLLTDVASYMKERESVYA
jgi:hypothetical protein